MEINLTSRYLGSMIASYTHFNCQVMNSDFMMIFFFFKTTVEPDFCLYRLRILFV